MSSFPVLPYFKFCAPLELNVARTVLSFFPRHVALLGSGPLPLTATFIVDRANEAGEQVSVLCVDKVKERIQQSERVCRQLGDYRSIHFQVTDILTGPEDLSEFDVVYCVALVGSTPGEKQALLLSIAERMKEGGILISRSTSSLKKLAYPVSSRIPFLIVDFIILSISFLPLILPIKKLTKLFLLGSEYFRDGAPLVGPAGHDVKVARCAGGLVERIHYDYSRG